MMKLVLCGLWVALVTGASAYFAPVVLKGSESTEGRPEAAVETVELKTDMTSVPMVRDGEILGYIIIQLSFAADKHALEEFKSEPGPYLIDAAFRTIFSSPQVDFRRLRASELDTLTNNIAIEANRRFGHEIVRQVLIQQLNFVKKEDIRTNWIEKQPGSH